MIPRAVFKGKNEGTFVPWQIFPTTASTHRPCHPGRPWDEMKLRSLAAAIYQGLCRVPDYATYSEKYMVILIPCCPGITLASLRNNLTQRMRKTNRKMPTTSGCGRLPAFDFIDRLFLSGRCLGKTTARTVAGDSGFSP